MLLRNKILIHFFIFQLVIFFLISFLIVKSFFSGEDMMHQSILEVEAKAFFVRYAQDANTPFINTPTLSTYYGVDALPEKYINSFKDLDQGVFSFDSGDGFLLDNEREVRVLVNKSPYSDKNIYFVSSVSDAKGEESIIKLLPISIMLYFSVVAMVGGFLAYFLSLNISQPLENIARKINLAKDDNPETDISSGDYGVEINFLARAIDEKNKRISEFVLREKHTMRNISHELRTPIAIMQSSLCIAKMNKNDDDDYIVPKNVVDKMQRACVDFEATIEAFLFLGREKTNIDEKVRCIDLVEKAINNHQYLLKKPSVSVSLEAEDNVTVMCQESIFYIVIANLVKNAFSFASEGDINIRLMSNMFSIQNAAKNVDFLGDEPMAYSGFGFGLEIVQYVCDQMCWVFTIRHDVDSGTLAMVDFS